jgi:hypothetical protein
LPIVPHDIRAAASRLRAPILRVFFPCSQVDQRTITACEAQLEDAGLWQHLSVGDIICNLGYLPPADDVGPSGSDTSSDDTPGPESWLIFDGTGLLPYTPSVILPLSDPLSLPSPLYYAHITSPPDNPRFIAALPREQPEFSLVLLPSRVRSPHSPNGFARIKKYQWLARLRPHVRPGLGEGWHGEWVLEGEGTKEGRQSLLDALNGNVNVKREWELVMERSTLSRIWLRSVLTPSPGKYCHFWTNQHPLSPLFVAGSYQLRLLRTSAFYDQSFTFPRRDTSARFHSPPSPESDIHHFPAHTHAYTVTYTNYGPSFEHRLQTERCQVPCRGLVTVQIHSRSYDSCALEYGCHALFSPVLHFFIPLRPQGHTDIQPGFIRSF